ncbi:MAG: DUF1735 domain-containing protein [Balneolaceae bacterium]
MKRILGLLLLAGIITSCYDEFRRDFDETTVAFSTASGDATDQQLVYRTVVLGEGLRLNYGVFLAGVIENNQERWADFEIDESLLDDYPDLELMPASYYTLSHDSRFTIESGSHIGFVTIELDSTAFVQDPETVNPYYAIPLRLTDTSEDRILESQSTKIVVVRYITRNAGYYNQTGSFNTYNSGGTLLNEGEIENVVTLSTVDPNTERTNGMINQSGSNHIMDIVLDESNDASFQYMPNPEAPDYGNIALIGTPGTSFVSGWENLNAINNGCEPGGSAIPGNDPNHHGCDGGQYGNWNQGGSWQWIGYTFDTTYQLDSSRVFWATDFGGLQPPTDSYIEYFNVLDEEFEQIPNSTMSHQLHEWDVIEFDDPPITDQIRVNAIVEGGDGWSVVEWQTWGIETPIFLEQQPIVNVAVDGTSSFDPSTWTYDLNYRVNYLNGNYTIVESTMTWRNRVRDGVNEWRR